VGSAQQSDGGDRKQTQGGVHVDVLSMVDMTLIRGRAGPGCIAADRRPAA
jgi:hypothetical protein